MVQLPSSARVNGAQKIFAWVLMGIAGFFVMKLANRYIFPEIEWFLKHLMLTAALASVPVAVIGYWVTHPLVVWGFFRTLSYKLTYWLVKQDPLSVMDRYVEYLEKKLAMLNTSIDILTGKKVKLDRQVVTIQDKVRNNIKLGAAAIKTEGKDSPEASLYGIKVQTDNNTIAILQPQQTRVNSSLEFMSNLSENWKFSIEQLKYQIDAKRSEYEIVKETAKGLKTVDAWINSDNEAVREYGMGVKALEEKVTQAIGYADNFTKKSKDMISNISIEKIAMKDEGLAELEKYIQGGVLKMPDFSKIGGITDVEYQTVPAQSGSKFNLLNK